MEGLLESFACVILNSIDFNTESGSNPVRKIVPASWASGRSIEFRMEIAEKRRRRANAVVPELDGRHIRMAGYALPLEFSDKTITEFLLVPWVGACIHTPPPPANQIVHVTLAEGIKPTGRFVPVWVTGKMAVKAEKKNLFLVDGSNDINIAYTLAAVKVTPFRQ